MEFQWDEIYLQWWFYTTLVQVLLALIIFVKLRCGYNSEVKAAMNRLNNAGQAPDIYGTVPLTTPNPGNKDDAPAATRQTRLSIFMQVPDSQVSPFVNCTWRFTTYEALKTSILGVTILPLRLIVVVVLLLLSSLWCALLTCGLPRHSDLPLSCARRAMVVGFMTVTLRSILFIMGFYWISTTGHKASGKEAPIIVANHICAFEAFVMTYLFFPKSVAEAANLNMFLLQPFVKAFRLLTFDRTSAEEREMVKTRLQDSAVMAMQGGSNPQVLIFPEGVTHNQSALVTFKTGAFVPGLPVLPVAIRMPYWHMDPSWTFCGPGLPMLFLRILTQFFNRIEINYLPVHIPNEDEKKNAQVFCNAVRAEIATKLGVPCTQHSIDDVMFQYKALRQHFPPTLMVNGGVRAVEQFFDLGRGDLENHFKVFMSMDTSKDGFISLEEFIGGFAKVSGAPITAQQSESLTAVFRMMDNSNDGRIDFKEYLLGLALSKEGKKEREEIMELVFNTFDRTGRGHITKTDCLVLMQRVFPDAKTTEEVEQMFANAATSSAATVDHLKLPAVSEHAKHEKEDVEATINFEQFKAFANAHPKYISMFKGNFFAPLNELAVSGVGGEGTSSNQKSDSSRHVSRSDLPPPQRKPSMPSDDKSRPSTDAGDSKV